MNNQKIILKLLIYRLYDIIFNENTYDQVCRQGRFRCRESPNTEIMDIHNARNLKKRFFRHCKTDLTWNTYNVYHYAYF